MRSDKLLVVCAIGVALWNMGLKYLYAIQRLFVKLWRLDFPKTDINGFEVDVVFAVKNPTSIVLPVDGFRGKVFLNDVELSDVVVPRQLVKSGVGELRICLWVRWSELGKGVIPELLKSNIGDSVLTIDGDLRIGSYGIGLNISKTFSELM